MVASAINKDITMYFVVWEADVGPGKKAQWIKVLALEPDNLSSPLGPMW